MMVAKSRTLTIINDVEGSLHAGRVYTHFSYGKVIEELAGRFKRVILCVPENPNASAGQDYLLPENVTLQGFPFMATALEGFLKGRGIIPVYRRAISDSDCVFIRGTLTPAVVAIYRICSEQNKPVLHWIVTNSMQLLKSHKREGFLRDMAGKLFVWQWEKKMLYGQKHSRAALLCNGSEIAGRYNAVNKYWTVSTTLRKDEIDTSRIDTCRNEVIRILSLGFVRPEKGFEYLIQAFAKVCRNHNAELTIAGSRDRYPDYQEKLDNLVRNYGISERVCWSGHLSYEMIPQYMRESDIFAFASLSEGTPRVLVEARAFGLPIVSTDAGGIKDSVTDGFDGILVPPANPDAMAGAIEAVINNQHLRRNLITNGYNTVKKLTVDRFADNVIEIYKSLECNEPLPANH